LIAQYNIFVVRSFGTEGRKKDGAQIPPSNEIFDYILFKSHDIKEITVCELPPVQLQQQSVPLRLPNNDPAIVSVRCSSLGSTFFFNSVNDIL
jgi:hypothetical protein